MTFHHFNPSFSIIKPAIYFAVLIMVAVIVASCAKTETNYYPSGRTESVITFRGVKKSGPATWYFENGAVRQKATYKNDFIEGTLTRFYTNGDKELEENYLHGKRNGISRSWGENRLPDEEKNFANDTLEGTYRKYFDDGNLKVEGSYRHGFFDGKWTYYAESGLVVGEANFVLGKGILTGFDLMGNKIREVEYVNNLRNGAEKWFDKQGTITKVLIYKNDKIVQSNADQ